MPCCYGRLIPGCCILKLGRSSASSVNLTARQARLAAVIKPAQLQIVHKEWHQIAVDCGLHLHARQAVGGKCLINRPEAVVAAWTR